MSSCVRGIIAQLKGLSLYKKDKNDDQDYFSALPTEILEMIFAYIRPKYLFENLLPVCRRFYSVVNNERWWNLRIQRHPLRSQLRDTERFKSSALRNWDDIWKEEEKWSSWDRQKRHVTVKNAFGPSEGEIDMLRLFTKSSSRFCLAASSIYNATRRYTGSAYAVWSLDNRTDNGGLLYKTDLQHAHAVCGIAMHGTDQFISGSYDRTVRLWSIDNSSIRAIALHSETEWVKEIAYENGLVACSSYFSTLSFHHVHNGLQELCRVTYTCPNGFLKDLMAIQFKGKLVHLAFEDELVTVDIRKLNKPVQKHTFAESFARNHTVEISMNWSDGFLQCCSNWGQVQEFEAATLKHCHSFAICTGKECVRSRKMKLDTNRGALMAITGTSVKAYSLRPRHEHLGTFTRFPTRQYPTAMDVLGGTVIVGFSRGSLITWADDD